MVITSEYDRFKGKINNRLIEKHMITTLILLLEVNKKSIQIK